MIATWWAGLVDGVTSGTYWWGVASGMVLFVLLLVLAIRYLPDPSGPSRRELRRRMEGRVFRAWCAAHEWCPEHDVADGQCPPVDTTIYPGGWVGLGACPGSSAIRVDPTLAPASAGTRG